MTAQVKIARYVNLSYLALACYALIIFFFSLNTAWTGDDINYRYSFCNGKVISSISDIIQSQYTHYFNVNGRSIAHALVQLFIPILGRTAFAFFNALMHILFILQIFKIAGVDKSNFRSMLTVIFLSMTAFITKMLPTCQIGFVWMFTITLFFLNIFFGNYKTPKSRVLTLPVLFILGILAGWSQEALIVGVGAALI
jgi:hypothetical protein